MRTQVKRLAPRAREQMFRNVLLNREDIHKDFEAYLGDCGIFRGEVFLLAFHKEKWFDYLEQFVVTNIITELLGSSHALRVTSIRNDVLLLLDGRVFDEIQPVIVKVKRSMRSLIPARFRQRLPAAEAGIRSSASMRRSRDS